MRRTDHIHQRPLSARRHRTAGIDREGAASDTAWEPKPGRAVQRAAWEVFGRSA
jgi:hypothetical protein